jgi:hypothetical protein
MHWLQFGGVKHSGYGRELSDLDPGRGLIVPQIAGEERGRSSEVNPPPRRESPCTS